MLRGVSTPYDFFGLYNVNQGSFEIAMTVKCRYKADSIFKKHIGWVIYLMLDGPSYGSR